MRQAGRFFHISDLALQALELFLMKIDFGAHIFLAVTRLTQRLSLSEP